MYTCSCWLLASAHRCPGTKESARAFECVLHEVGKSAGLTFDFTAACPLFGPRSIELNFDGANGCGAVRVEDAAVKPLVLNVAGSLLHFAST
jgi:hypothetical protein